MRPPLHFDGEPNRFAQMRKLFPTTRTARVLYATADRAKLRIRLQRVEDWLRKWSRAS